MMMMTMIIINIIIIIIIILSEHIQCSYFEFLLFFFSLKCNLKKSITQF